MQATTSTFIRRNSSSNVSPANHVGPISVPRPLFGKLVDFLEDRWGTKVIRRKNAFYCAAHQEQPIAWLNSQDTVTIFLIDRASGRRNATRIRIEDIRASDANKSRVLSLPKPDLSSHQKYRAAVWSGGSTSSTRLEPGAFLPRTRFFRESQIFRDTRAVRGFKGSRTQ